MIKVRLDEHEAVCGSFEDAMIELRYEFDTKEEDKEGEGRKELAQVFKVFEPMMLRRMHRADRPPPRQDPRQDKRGGRIGHPMGRSMPYPPFRPREVGYIKGMRDDRERWEREDYYRRRYEEEEWREFERGRPLGMPVEEYRRREMMRPVEDMARRRAPRPNDPKQGRFLVRERPPFAGPHPHPPHLPPHLPHPPHPPHLPPHPSQPPLSGVYDYDYAYDYDYEAAHKQPLPMPLAMPQPPPLDPYGYPQPPPDPHAIYPAPGHSRVVSTAPSPILRIVLGISASASASALAPQLLKLSMPEPHQSIGVIKGVIVRDAQGNIGLTSYTFSPF
ncbi:hypothetical protein BDF14DRAFT_1741761 [Spinellus fusiger]|nr:hypothetical protein BDF14DRAFT_1741761 [Spinellus fusiger]